MADGGMPGLGTELCLGSTNAGAGCHNREIEGLEYCLHHVPDALLEEAENITGTRRCRTRFGQPDACRQYAVEGTEPPTCKNHGANVGGNQLKGAARRVIMAGAEQRAAELVSEHGGKLLNPDVVSDPFGELMNVAGEMRAWKDLLVGIVARLREAQFRYSGKTGEQIRAEIVLYERALDRYATILINIARLNLDERLVGVREQTANMMERALNAAMERAEVPLDRQLAAREVFRRELRIVA